MTYLRDFVAWSVYIFFCVWLGGQKWRILFQSISIYTSRVDCVLNLFGPCKFTTIRGKCLTNQQTGDPLKDQDGNMKYFAKVDKFYSIDEEVVVKGPQEIVRTVQQESSF